MASPGGYLYVLGFGVDPESHATIEALQALGFCDEVHTSGLEPRHRLFLGRFCQRGVSPVAVAEPSRIAAAVRGALNRGRIVAFCTPGHPFYWSDQAGALVRHCEKRGIPWRTFGAVSPMGVALSAVGLTLGTNVFGLHSLDLTALAQGAPVANPTWPLVLYSYRPLRPGQGRRAFERLLEIYGREVVATLCEGACAKPVALAQLAQRGLRPDQVLVLPARQRPRGRIGRTDRNHRPGQQSEGPAWVG